MEIWEAREILNAAFKDFFESELPRNRRLLIVFKQIETLGYNSWLLPGVRYELKANKAIIGSIQRHQKKLRKQQKRGTIK